MLNLWAFYFEVQATQHYVFQQITQTEKLYNNSVISSSPVVHFVLQSYVTSPITIHTASN